jgi:membrane fusion protein (multidrug efflux system)
VLVIVAALPACGKKDETAVPPQAAKPAEAGKPPAAGAPATASGGAGAAAAPAKPSGMPVKAQPVRLDTVQNEVTAVGSLIADEAVIVRPEIAGRVVELPFREGQAVHKGAKLVVIDGSEYEAVLAQAKADAKTETQRYERTIDLFKNKFVSQDAVDVAKGNMDRAVARVQENEARLAKTTIYAPFSGILGLRLISPGAYVKAGDDIVRLENTSALKLDFRVPEVYVSKLKPTQIVAVRTDAYPNDVFEGHIYALEPSVDEKTRTVVARAEIPNKQGKLRPGMFGRVNVLLESHPNAVMVPEQAIWPQGRDAFVYKVVDGKAVLTKVDIGSRRPGEVEISKGLASGDVIVTDGQMKIKDGAPVMVLPPPPPPPAAAGPAPAPKAGG